MRFGERFAVPALVSTGLLLAGSAAPASAETPTDLGSLSWIAGDWVGGQEGTVIEERWSEPVGNSMMGMFRLVAEGQVRFYEFMSIEQGSSGPVLRIKHFDPGLRGWEERDESITFELRESSRGRAVFETELEGSLERLIFERSNDELVIILDKPAKPSRTEFLFHRR